MTEPPDEEFEVHAWPPNRGGQHVGPRVGVLVLHTPTGLACVSESERSQVRNRDAARSKLNDVLEMMGEWSA